MHEGGWEPFVHHFSSVLGDVVLQDEETRVSERRGTTPARRERLLCSGTWGLKTKRAERHHARRLAPHPAGPRHARSYGSL